MPSKRRCFRTLAEEYDRIAFIYWSWHWSIMQKSNLLWEILQRKRTGSKTCLSSHRVFSFLSFALSSSICETSSIHSPSVMTLSLYWEREILPTYWERNSLVLRSSRTSHAISGVERVTTGDDRVVYIVLKGDVFLSCSYRWWRRRM